MKEVTKIRQKTQNGKQDIQKLQKDLTDGDTINVTVSTAKDLNKEPGYSIAPKETCLYTDIFISFVNKSIITSCKE